MSGALKMARLDQYSMKSPFGMYGTLLVVLFLLSFTGLSLMSAAITTAWVMALHLPMIFLVQEKDALERLYASLALSDCEVVVGRYLYMFSHFVIALIMAMFFGVLLPVLQGKGASIESVVAGIAVSILMFTFIVSVQTPLYFTMGYAKGQLFGLIPYGAMLILVIATVFNDSSMQMARTLMQWPLLLLLVSLAASVGMVVISYRSSLKSYRMFR